MNLLLEEFFVARSVLSSDATKDLCREGSEALMKHLLSDNQRVGPFRRVTVESICKIESNGSPA